MVPKILWTCWLNEKQGYPELVEKCIESQKKCAQDFGYEHRIITLENFYKGSIYVNDAIRAKKWVKASDYLRVYNLYTEGGIFLDADMEILSGKNFDAFLDNRMFTSKEVKEMFANSAMGCEPGHPIFKEYLRRLDENFRGDGDLTFEPGIRAFCDLFWIADLEKEGIKIYPTDYFYPYHHVTKEMNITENTVLIHHYMNSWVK